MITNRIFTDAEKEIIKNIRKLEFPKSWNLDIDRQLWGENICGITNGQVAKIQKLWFNVYGHRRNGYDHAHHNFLQGIVEHKEMNYIYGHKRLSDECLIDVYSIAPELFDVDKVKSFYENNGTLIEEIITFLKIKENKSCSGHREFTFFYLENKKTKDQGVFKYNESRFTIELDEKDEEKWDRLNLDRYMVIDMIEENRRVEILGKRSK